MLYPVMLLSTLRIIPAVHAADQIPGYAADALKGYYLQLVVQNSLACIVCADA